MGKAKRTLRHREEKDGEVKRLKGIIRRLESDKRKLLSEVKTLEEAFEKTIVHVKGKINNKTIEEVLKDINEGKNLIAKEPKDTTCKKCKNGEMCRIDINRHDGLFVLYRCNNKDCKYMSEMKKHED